ncbi:MAG: hypothetical protein EAZ35_02225 [Sphingobacteriia bacterium]|nr:MAG: hypothetical protein EAZ35_02225 [Sphingobacteriia bacterium]
MLFNVPIALVFGVLFILSFVFPAFSKSQPTGFLLGIYREAWDSQLIKRFDTSDQTGWRQGIRDIGKYFSMLQDGETVVVNLTYFGVSPDVLIDNTAYPIAIQQLDGENVAITVKKFQTKATPITDDEIFGLNYNKMQAVQESHAIKIEEDKNSMALHNIAPNANIAAMPVLLTTGDLVNGRRMCRGKDLLTLRDSLNRLLHPRDGRRLILCNDHINDLLSEDQKFADQYYDSTDGRIFKRFNFEFFESSTNPFYNAAAKTKLAYGAVPVAGTHTEASVYFHISRLVQGKGFTKNYLSQSAQDPLQQRNLYNVRHYDIVTRYRNEGVSVIASATA